MSRFRAIVIKLQIRQSARSSGRTMKCLRQGLVCIPWLYFQTPGAALMIMTYATT
ncbi:hypothetical protein QFZ98_001712 [Paraburkholderia youngii]